ncbi:MAG: 16S rRNA (cytosine(1402)-N(4))-methyltransferase RsmH [Eggerthellaceae bacterium]|nr:16S rRNA (cytosine(1402)-N(4))-methyltransferase RsmH [Eggerthellaceae bacterium]
MNSEFKHIPVLFEESLDALALREDSVHVDCTLGGAGHGLAVYERLDRHGSFIGIDQDAQALETSEQKLSAARAKNTENSSELFLAQANFAKLEQVLLDAEVPGIDSIFFDLGISSHQIDNAARGFSFKEDGPLDMRMNTQACNCSASKLLRIVTNAQVLTARDVVNNYSKQDLAQIIKDHSDEKWAKRIAEFICKEREIAPIETSFSLVEVIKKAIPACARREGGHPVRRTFQALRIEVNRELEVLQTALDAATTWLNPGGRIAVISYHSLEDRIVKAAFAKGASRCECPPELPVCACGKKPYLKILSKQAIVPGKGEIEANPRARSAKLRVAEKVENG